jgi:hypothetical protein
VCVWIIIIIIIIGLFYGILSVSGVHRRTVGKLVGNELERMLWEAVVWFEAFPLLAHYSKGLKKTTKLLRPTGSEPKLELVPPEYERGMLLFRFRHSATTKLFVCCCWNLFANLVLLCKTGPISLSRRTLLCGRWLVGELKTVSDLGTWCKSGIENHPDTVPLICYIPTKHGF